jgi:surface antigen
MKNFVFAMMVFSMFSLTACQTLQGKGNKEVVGAGTGAVLGGLAGSAIGSGSGKHWAIGAGVLAGALLGSEVGKSLDKADMAYANQANHRAYNAPVGETITWNNPESGNHGSVTPVKDGYSASGKYCREYQQTIYVGGQEETAYGKACRQPDGSWKIIN